MSTPHRRVSAVLVLTILSLGSARSDDTLTNPHLKITNASSDLAKESATKGASVSLGKRFVLYTTADDSAAACDPFLDAPLHPFSSPSAHGGFEIRFSAVSLAQKGDNCWLEGEMAGSGALKKNLRVDCRPILASPHDPNAAHHQGSQWLMGFVKAQNGAVYSLVHDEYYGGAFPVGANFSIPASAQCNLGAPNGRAVNPFTCTYATVSIAKLSEADHAFHLPSAHVVARPSFDFVDNAGRVTGYFTNTNVVHASDGGYYALVADLLPDGSQRRCPIRASDIRSAATWRGWDGHGYGADLPEGADCQSVNLQIFPFYVGYNLFYKKFIAVGGFVEGSKSVIAYSLSSDMVAWSNPVSFGVTMYQGEGDWDGVNYPSLIDPEQLAKVDDENASVGALTGKNPWLVFVQHNRAQQSRATAIVLNFASEVEPAAGAGLSVP